VAAVDASGRVTARSKSGAAVITARMNDGGGASATCRVTVPDHPRKGAVLKSGNYRYKVVKEKATVALVGTESRASAVTLGAGVKTIGRKVRIVS